MIKKILRKWKGISEKEKEENNCCDIKIIETRDLDSEKCCVINKEEK